MDQKTQQTTVTKLHHFKGKIPLVELNDLMPYHNPKECKLPKDPKDIDNCYVIKMAARYAAANKLIGVRYSHAKANHSSNNYEPHVVLLDTARIVVEKHHVLVSRASIGISNFAVLNPQGRKILAV